MKRGISKNYSALRLPKVDFLSKFQLDSSILRPIMIFFNIYPPFGGVLWGEGCPKTIKLFGSQRLIFGPNFSAQSKIVLEVNLIKSTKSG